MEDVNNFILEIVKILVLGVTQGFSDFLPISAEGRYELMRKIIGADVSAAGNMYVLMFLQLGTLLAILFVFRSRIAELCGAVGRIVVNLFTGRFAWKKARSDQKLVILILLSYVPVIIALPFLIYFNATKLIEDISWLTAIFFFVAAVFYLFADRVKGSDRNHRSFKVRDALFTGVANAFGLIPGVSGVGLVATVCSRRHLKKSFCAEYAFLLAIPAALTKTLIYFFRAYSAGESVVEIPYGFFGMFVAFGMGIVAINVIGYLLKYKKMYIYAVISAGLGAIMLAFQFLL